MGEKSPSESVTYWHDKYFRGEITLDECTTVCRLLIYKERNTLAMEIIRWCLVLLGVGSVTWLFINLP